MRISKRLSASVQNREFSKRVDRGKDRFTTGFFGRNLIAGVLVERSSNWQAPEPPRDKIGSETGGVISGSVPADKPLFQQRVKLKVAIPLRDTIPLDGGAFARRRPMVSFRQL